MTMTFGYGIFSFICFGLSDSFVLHPPSRLDDEDDDDDNSSEESLQPVVPLTPPRSPHPDHSSYPNPSGYSAACNVTLCETGSRGLSDSCCGYHVTIHEPWVWIFGLVAAVALYAMIAYCYVWRKSRAHQGHRQNQLGAILFGGTTYADSSGYNINHYTPPPEYAGVSTSSDLPVGEEPPPTYEEAMYMTSEHQGRGMSTEQNSHRRRVEYSTGRIIVEDGSRGVAPGNDVERTLLEDTDKGLIAEDSDVRIPLEDISKGMTEEDIAANVLEQHGDVARPSVDSSHHI